MAGATGAAASGAGVGAAGAAASIGDSDSLTAGAWLPDPAVSCAMTAGAVSNEIANKVLWICLLFIVFNLLARRLGALCDDPVTAEKLLGKRPPTIAFLT